MKRQPEGIPVGGQFAAERKAEPTGSISDPIAGEASVTGAGSEMEISWPAGTRPVDREVGAKDVMAFRRQGLRGRLEIDADYADTGHALWTTRSGSQFHLRTDPWGWECSVQYASEEVVPLRPDFVDGTRLASDSSAADVADAAMEAELRVDSARAWLDTDAGKGTRDTTDITGVVVGMGGNDSWVGGRTARGTQFELSVDDNGRVSGSTGELGNRWAMDAEDVEAYSRRALGATSTGNPLHELDETMAEVRTKFMALRAPAKR